MPRLLIVALFAVLAAFVPQSAGAQQSVLPPADGITLGFADDIVYGEEDAPVTLIEYASMTCSHCGTFATEIFPRLNAKYIQTGRVRMLFRNFVLNRTDMAIVLITRCQDETQARAMIDKYFATQSTWLQTKQPGLAITSIANGFGLSEQDINTCLSNQPLQQAILKRMQEGQAKYEISGTPTIVVNGDKLANYAWETVDAAVADALEEAGAPLEIGR